MDGFGVRVREALVARGLTLRGAARELSYDPSYLSRVLNGQQVPSPQLVQALDALLDMDGELIRMAKERNGPTAVPAPAAAPDGSPYVRSTVGHLLDHDRRFGGDHVASAAVQVWRSEQRKLDLTPQADKGHVSAVSEMAEVAGWLLFDAHRYEESRRAFMESQLLAQQAGDKPMRWFALDLLAMLDVQSGRSGEALRIADEILTASRLPQRVELLARTRRARALAEAGDRSRSLTEIGRALSDLQDSISVRDPTWTWWVNETEVIGHRGEVLMSLGDYAAAIPDLSRARESTPEGRGALYYSVAELTAYARVGAWRECETSLNRLPALLESVSSSRSRARLSATVRVIERDGPAWVADLSREIATPHD
ncbi:helix-turn-helix transcriptional regulator [Streptomyces sp. NPDC051662]|uniref:helix-turn-helix domain-containing protein n=1 Tax=Streptomyces sp. NPDC051662 TaxID=3154750 RepID=UPI00342BE4B8